MYVQKKKNSTYTVPQADEGNYSISLASAPKVITPTLTSGQEA